MSVFSTYESQVLRTLLSSRYSGSEIDAVINEASFVALEHTGVGYFLTVTHPLMPSTRTVCSQPQVEGRFRDVHCGFVLFLEDGELTFECFSYPSQTNSNGDVPGDLREQPVKIKEAGNTGIIHGASIPSRPRHQEPSLPRHSVNYLTWFNRVLGWDAALPLLVSTGSVLIARTLKNQPPADILALVGLPVLAFSFRFALGTYQIKSNACGNAFRGFQLLALVMALFILAFVDFFVALVAFLPKGNAPKAEEMLPLYAVTLLTYVTLVAFAMYPGRYSTTANSEPFSRDL